MNHLELAKDMSGNKKGYDGQEEIIAHALIAIAEQQERRLLLEASKVAELSKIAEQLERMNTSPQPLEHMAVKEGLFELHHMCESIPDGDGTREELDQLVTDLYLKIDNVLSEFPDEEDK